MKFKKLLFFILALFLFQVSIFTDIINCESLPEAVSSEENEKEYSFNGTQTIDVDLGELKGVSLTINGTQNIDSIINSTGTYGITLSTTATSAQHLVINNVSGFNNFKSAIVNNKSVSTITINNSEFNNNEYSLKGSAIYNLGYLEVNNSTFSLNSSSYGGAVINGDGAVNNIQKSSKAHFDNVLFENNSAQTGGAVFNDVNSTIYMNNVFFSTNTVTGRDDKYGGGAIANKGTITITDNSSFIDNESNISGGAIENSKTLNIYGFTEFIGNHATQTGGAILNSDYNNTSTYFNSVNISSGAIFKDNSAKDGGAIDNDGDFFLTANTNDITFINNTASNFGGAIYNRIYSTVDLKTTDTNTISFINNTATERGGAIYAYTGSTTKIGDGVIFSSNSAKIGGAISTITDALFTRRPTIIIGNNVEFSSNTATKSDTVTGSAGGGAIHAYGSDVTIGNDAKFFSNKTVVDGGGAIRNGNSGSVLNIGNNAQFISNSAKEGGALYNINSGSMYIGNGMFLSSNTADNGGAVRNVSAYSYLGENAVFSFNTATQNGGAIHNDTRFTYSQNGHPAEVTINKNAEFNSNTANLKGGAIYNYTYYESLQLDKKATITIQDGAKFINNSSNDNGGAIYNESGILNLIANTVNVEFTGNTANGVSNAIHTSSGIINLWASENADIIFNDRITSKNNTSVLNINSSTTTLTANGKITLNEDMSGYTGTVNLYNGNLVLEDGNSFFNTDNFTVHGGTFTANANNILKGFTNNGTVSFTGGENSNWISGTGKTIIDGEVINSSTIANAVTINAQKKLTTKVDEITGDIENNGELEFNNNGENSNWISGSGRTIIAGEVINSSTIVNAVTINAQKKLTTNASDVIGDINNLGNYVMTGGENSNWISGTGTTVIDGTVLNSSTIANDVIINKNKQLTTNATNISGIIEMEEEGCLIFNEGENNNIIMGEGDIVINGIVSNNKYISSNNLQVSSNKNLINNSTITINESLLLNDNSKITNDCVLLINNGINNGNIEQTINISTTAIYGNFINNGRIEQNIFNVEENGTVQNNSIIIATQIINNGNLETSATKVTGNIINNGTLNFIGGINNNTVTGVNGILIVSDNLENNFAIEQSSITINGVVTNNSNMEAENIYLNGTFNVGANGSFFTATNSTIYDGSEINLQNYLIQEHNFGNLTVESGTVNLVVDADLETETMDTISASDNSSVNGTINIKAINVLTDTKKFKTEVLFTSSTVLKDKISSINSVSSKLYKYDVSYNDGYFKFINVSNELNPIIAESAIASSVGGFATQTNILGQVFSSIDTMVSSIKSRHQSSNLPIFKSPNLYASASSSIFDMENKIERGLWIRPYAVQETIKFNEVDVDNTAIGTLAGLDLVAGENTLLSFYLGYAGSNQKYEGIKINQTGYIVGATGMVIKEKWYAGLTANINFNKAESQSDYGTDNFDMNMYSIGVKAGYNFDLSDKWILEPNLMLMYGNVNSQEYETTQGAKIDSQSTTNIIVEPQVKAKLSLDNGWQPYGLLGYVANISDKGKVVADEIEIETDKINGYVEYGVGVNKDFINTPWSCYLQATGRSGGINGFAGNLGVKYKF